MITPKSFLFVTWEGGGNLPPVMGTARRLHQRGHRVRILSEPCVREVSEKEGIPFIPFKEYFDREDRSLDLLKDEKVTPFHNPSFDNVFFGPAAIVAKETMEALEAVPTDVLVSDVLMMGSTIASEAMGIPTVLLNHMPEFLPGSNRPPGIMGLPIGEGPMYRLRDKLLKALFKASVHRYAKLINRIRADYGLPLVKDLIDLYNRPELRLIQTHREFDRPLEPAPANVRYTGPVLDDPDYVSPWQSPWSKEDKRPLVVVSLSSTFMNQAQTIQNCISALSPLKVRALVTLGIAMADEAFSAPENVKIVSSAPHAQVFPQADLVITHAGHGTVMKALAHGLPLLCLPKGRDQKDNALKVVAHGLGLRLNPTSKPEKIGQAVTHLLNEQSFSEQAKRWQARILKDAARNQAVHEIERLAGVREMSAKEELKV